MSPEPRPVDVERGLFHLVDSGRLEDAEMLLSSALSLASGRQAVASGEQAGYADDAAVSPLCPRPSVCDDGSKAAGMQKEYVQKTEGAYRIAGTRVSLDSLVCLYREGMSAESMVESYPALTLEQVHGALAFYLANQSEIDAYLAEGQHAAEAQQRQSRQTNAELIAKLQRARNASQIPG